MSRISSLAIAAVLAVTSGLAVARPAHDAPVIAQFTLHKTVGGPQVARVDTGPHGPNFHPAHRAQHTPPFVAHRAEHRAEHRIDERQREQSRQIRHGERSGRLDSRELRSLDRQQAEIRRVEVAALSDGRLNPHELRRLEQLQNQAQRDIDRALSHRRGPRG